MNIPNDTRTLERFFKKVQKTDGCHIWTGSRNTGGYGSFALNGTCKTAHRLAYGIAYGPFDPNLHVDHMCHNRACVNPKHLRLVTRSQNGQNRAGATRRSKTGIRGVSWHSQRNKWRAAASHAGQKYSAGLHDSIEEAEKAVIALRNRLYTHNDIDRLKS